MILESLNDQREGTKKRKRERGRGRRRERERERERGCQRKGDLTG